jgi:hypothetical protein
MHKRVDKYRTMKVPEPIVLDGSRLNNMHESYPNSISYQSQNRSELISRKGATV